MTTTVAVSATPEHGVSPSSVRALWLTETYPPSRGGMSQSCDRIVRGLRGRGVAVDVLHFTSRPRGRPWAIERQAGGRYLCCPIEGDPAHALNRAWSVLSADAETAGVTHVVAFGGSRPIVAAPVFAAWLGVPLVTLIRGNDFDAAVFSVRRRPVLDDALARSAIVCTVSQDKAEKIAALHPGVRVQWIPNGIDASDWTPIPSDIDRAASWRAANVDPDALVLGLFGQLKAKKGGVLLLEALRRSGVIDAFHLLLAGWLEPEMEAWLGEHAGELRFSSLPFLDRYELLPWYAACDWIAIPSFYDGLPNVLVEAAALGVPLIASRTGGMADVLIDGVTAFLFEAGDEAGCGWALRRAASLADGQHRAMGDACRALAANELNADLEISRYVEVLTSCSAAPETIPFVPRAARA